MKSYVTETQSRFVGKAWEIRRHLSRMCSEADDGDALLAALLPRLIGSHERGKLQLEPQRKPR